MNQWSQKTISLATQKNYLDQLQLVYAHEEGERKITESTLKTIRESFDKNDKRELLDKLLNLGKFPYKDSYVAFLRKDRTAFDRNPETIKRIIGRLNALGIDGVIKGISQAKEANMRRGPQFGVWMKSNFTLVDKKDFIGSKKGIVILKSNERDAMEFCNNTLDLGLIKRPDIVAKAGTKYVVGETKFLSEMGGNQHRGFDDGAGVVASISGKASKIFLLDGIIWISQGSGLFKKIINSEANIFSILLLKDFLTEKCNE